MYLVSSFWLPLPFLTIRGVDRGEEKAELWIILALHSAENFLIVLASRLVYLQESYPTRIVAFDCVLVILNILAVLLSVFYVSKMELFAGLPQNPSSHPTFGPEDVPSGDVKVMIGKERQKEDVPVEPVEVGRHHNHQESAREETLGQEMQHLDDLHSDLGNCS